MPYDQNRIHLQAPCAGCDYINASPLLGSTTAAAAADGSAPPPPPRVHLVDGSPPSPAGPGSVAAADAVAAEAAAAAVAAQVAWSYIAAQGPLRHTREAFWQMALEQGVRVVVMLTNLADADLQKCAQVTGGPGGAGREGGAEGVGGAASQALLGWGSPPALGFDNRPQGSQSPWGGGGSPV